MNRLDTALDGLGVAPAPLDTGATTQPPHPRLAEESNILGLFSDAVRLRGVVGESASAQLLYLAITSRVLAKPVSIAVKGASSSGKSWTTEKTTEFFPDSAVLPFTSVSEKALIHTRESYQHRTLIFYEVTGLRENAEDNLTAYFIRTLLSEGRLVYEYTAGTPGNFYTQRVVKEGPTNVVFTTTKTTVHPENETRCLSLNTDDSPEQTSAILRAMAREDRPVVDLRPWHELQTWLQENGERRVSIPFAERLASLVPPVSVRLRRDFSAVLALIRVNALLHQLNRNRDNQGRVIAKLEDYRVVRDLVADVVSEGVQATVSPSVRETAEALEILADGMSGDEGITAVRLGRHLGIDKSNAARRLRRAADSSYVKNLETRRGRPGLWAIGDPLPDEVAVLPEVATLERNHETDAAIDDSGSGCVVASDSGNTCKRPGVGTELIVIEDEVREEGEV